jgi:hypothetical protein
MAGGQSAVVGIATFAYAYIVTLPSWVNEKQPHVRARCMRSSEHFVIFFSPF